MKRAIRQEYTYVGSPTAEHLPINRSRNITHVYHALDCIIVKFCAAQTAEEILVRYLEEITYNLTYFMMAGTSPDRERESTGSKFEFFSI